MFRLPSLCAAGAMALALISTAPLQAADVYRPVPTLGPSPLAYSSSAYDWSGLYAGVHAGVDASGRAPMPFSKETALEGGAHVGSNIQMGPIVVGAELEANYARDLQTDLGAGASLTQNWSAAAKARAGFALDNVMVFGTVGYGFARLDPGGTVTSGAQTVGGVNFGGGAEVGLNESLSLRLDYQQSRFDNVSYTAGGTTQSVDLVNHAVRGGLSFRY